MKGGVHSKHVFTAPLALALVQGLTLPTALPPCREAEDAFIAERDADDPGHEWERVAKMCDFSGKGSRTTKDVSRMRSIFLHLKQDPLVR